MVLTVLAILTGFIGINVSRALREQRFHAEVKLVVDQLRLAQDLMLIFNTNVQFKVISTDDGIAYGLEFDQPLTKRWSRELQRVHKNLKTIHAINFDTDTFGEGAGAVRFLSGGAVMSHGMIRLATADRSGPDVLESYIHLPGYPAPIEAVSTRHPENLNKRDSAFDEQLTQRTREEVQIQVAEAL